MSRSNGPRNEVPAPARGAGRQSEQALCESAARCREAGDIAGLLSAQRELVDRFPGRTRHLTALACTLCEVHDHAGAVPLFERALAAAPGDPELHYRLGLALAEEGAPVRALECYRHCLALRPAYPEALCARGMALNDVGRHGEAERAFQQALEADPRQRAAHHNLGLAKLARDDPGGALRSFRRCLTLEYPVWHEAPVAAGGLSPPDGALPEQIVTSPFKLRHDAEQLEYLVAERHLPESYLEIPRAYRAVLDNLPADSPRDLDVRIVGEGSAFLRRVYNQAVYLPRCPALDGPAVNPDLDTAAIEARYRDARPSLVVVDGLLTPEALEALRRWSLESTVWFNVKSGYLGAYLWAGFNCGLLLQIAVELRRRLAGVFGDHALQTLWGYKYDHQLAGIPTHGDSAAVNVNFWLTPDEANRDPRGGGLVVYDRAAPRHWSFARYNMDHEGIAAFLKASGSRPVRVPYRQNRAVIFDSSLLHRTDDFSFEPGYVNRRLNVTMLYGQR